MLIESIKAIAKEIKNVYSEEIPNKLKKEDFKEFFPEFTGRKIAFVDGGNLKILGGANFSILFNRVYYCVFKNNKRVKINNNKAEFFSLTYSKKEDEIIYETKLFPVNEFSKEILPEESDLKVSLNDNFTINSVENMARIFSEWNMTKKAIENLDNGIVVRDGSLQTGVKNETNYANEVYSLAINKKIFLIGISKTCTLFTEDGYSLLSAINNFADSNNFKNEWYCEYLFEIKEFLPISLNFVKFNKNSKYIFRVENLKEQNEKEEIFKNLAIECKNMVFPGYPYGLIDADKNARVRKKEAETLKTIVLSEIAKNKELKNIEILIKSVNAHELLNDIV